MVGFLSAAADRQSGRFGAFFFFFFLSFLSSFFLPWDGFYVFIWDSALGATWRWGWWDLIIFLQNYIHLPHELLASSYVLNIQFHCK